MIDNPIVGMRVALAEGPWESGPRTPGHYGKISHIDSDDEGDRIVVVDITGHVDRQPPIDFAHHDIHWFYPEELTVVD